MHVCKALSCALKICALYYMYIIFNFLAGIYYVILPGIDRCTGDKLRWERGLRPLKLGYRDREDLTEKISRSEGVIQIGGDKMFSAEEISMKGCDIMYLAVQGTAKRSVWLLHCKMEEYWWGQGRPEL